MFVTDLDDTLYREVDYVYSGYKAIGKILEEDGIMPQTDVVDFLQSSENTARGFDDLAARLWLAHPGCRFTADWMVEVYRYHMPSIAPLPDVIPTLERLKAVGITIGIITDGRSVTQRSKIKALGLGEFVAPQNIIISEEVGADKTTSAPFETLASRNIGEEKFLYIGDNPAKDFHWPNMMGWTTVELRDCQKTNIHTQDIAVDDEFRPKHIIDSFGMILKYLQYC